MTQDAALLTEYAETHSETAFRALVDRHLGLVYATALQRLSGDTHAARDVAQNVFVLLARKARQLGNHPSLAGWLYRTADLQASQMNRGERRRRNRETAVVVLQDPAVEPPTGADGNELGRNIAQVVQELNPRDREAVLLRYFEQLSFAEIAGRLALSEHAAHKRVERALDRLRQRLAARGIVSTATALAATLNAQSVVSVPAGLATGVVAAAIAAPMAATGLLGLLSLTNATWAVAVLTSVLAVNLARQDASEQIAIERALADSRHETAALLDEIHGVNEKLAALERDHQAFAADDANAPAPKRPGVSPPDATGSVSPAIVDSARMLEQDPQVRAALHKITDWDNQHYFGPMLAAAGATPDQIRRAEAVLENVSIAGFAPEPLSLAAKTRNIEQEIRGIVGPAGVAAVDSVLVRRGVVEGLAGTLYNTDSPLTKAQAARLNRDITDANRTHLAGWYDPQTTDWTKAIADATTFLTPTQIEHLRMLAAVRFGGPGR